MPKIDAHQHFWKYNAVRDSWIDESMSAIQRDFLPSDLHPLLQKNGIDGCVVVQSDQSKDENDFQLAQADKYDFIKGIVGWVDFQSAEVEEQLSYYQQFAKMKGFRHVLQGEPQRDFMLRPEFKSGIGLLHKYHFTYDLLVLPDQLGYTEQFVSLFPDQPFVLDHLAKPLIKTKQLTEWKKAIAALAVHENTCCKISGMITEADWLNWQPSDFFPYLDVVVEAFGTKRILFGSDWPVCLLAGSYERMLSVVTEYFSTFTENERQLFFGGNAMQFYNL